MSGPWLGFAKLLAKEIGKAGGKKVAADVQAAESMFKWTHAQKVAELKDDVGLSSSYVKDLINDSDKIDDLRAVTEYLQKDNGYTGSTMKFLYERILNRISVLEEKDAMKEMLRLFREKGTSLLETIDFDHFV